MIFAAGPVLEETVVDPPVGVSTAFSFTPSEAPVMPGGLRRGDLLMVLVTSCYPAGGDQLDVDAAGSWTPNTTSFSSGGLRYLYGPIHRSAQSNSSDYPDITVDRGAYSAPTAVVICARLVCLRGTWDRVSVPGGVSSQTGLNPAPPNGTTYTTPGDREFILSMAMNRSLGSTPEIATANNFELVTSLTPVSPDGLPAAFAIRYAATAGTYDACQWSADTGLLVVSRPVYERLDPPKVQQAILV